MFDLTLVFSSKARFKSLRTLFYQSSPLPLRHIAYLSDMPVFSIQRALIQLVDETIIRKKKKKHYSLFSLNPHHPYYSFLVDMFDLEMKNRNSLLSGHYHKKAKNLLHFLSSTLNLFQKVDPWT